MEQRRQKQQCLSGVVGNLLGCHNQIQSVKEVLEQLPKEVSAITTVYNVKNMLKDQYKLSFKKVNKATNAFNSRVNLAKQKQYLIELA